MRQITWANRDLRKSPNDRFVEREIYFREAQEIIAPDSISKEEVIDEAIAAALSDGQEKPESWLSRPGSTVKRCAPSTVSRILTRATGTRCIWKTRPAVPM